MKCKVTGNKIKPFMSFGKMPIANGFKKKILKRIFFNLEMDFQKRFRFFKLMIIQTLNKCLIKITPLQEVLKECKTF